MFDLTTGRRFVSVLMKLSPEIRLPIIMTALDYTLKEIGMTFEELTEVREEVIEVVGEA